MHHLGSHSQQQQQKKKEEALNNADPAKVTGKDQQVSSALPPLTEEERLEEAEGEEFEIPEIPRSRTSSPSPVKIMITHENPQLMTLDEAKAMMANTGAPSSGSGSQPPEFKDPEGETPFAGPAGAAPGEPEGRVVGGVSGEESAKEQPGFFGGERGEGEGIPEELPRETETETSAQDSVVLSTLPEERMELKAFVLDQKSDAKVGAERKPLFSRIPEGAADTTNPPEKQQLHTRSQPDLRLGRGAPILDGSLHSLPNPHGGAEEQSSGAFPALRKVMRLRPERLLGPQGGRTLSALRVVHQDRMLRKIKARSSGGTLSLPKLV